MAKNLGFLYDHHKSTPHHHHSNRSLYLWRSDFHSTTKRSNLIYDFAALCRFVHSNKHSIIHTRRADIEENDSYNAPVHQRWIFMVCGDHPYFHCKLYFYQYSIKIFLSLDEEHDESASISWKFALFIFYFRINKLMAYKNELESQFKLSKYAHSIYSIVKLLLTLLFINHIFSCFWVLIGTISNQNNLVGSYTNILMIGILAQSRCYKYRFGCWKIRGCYVLHARYNDLSGLWR